MSLKMKSGPEILLNKSCIDVCFISLNISNTYCRKCWDKLSGWYENYLGLQTLININHLSKKVLMINRYRGISIIDAWHVKREVISYLHFFILLSSEIWKPDLFQITWYAFPGTYFCRIIIYKSCFSDWDFGIFSMKLIEYVFIFTKLLWIWFIY